jgi:outer membrane protein assembly factor BamB
MNNPQRKKFRWGWAIAVLIVTLAAMVYVQTNDRVEGNFKFPLTLGVVLSAGLALNLLMLLGGLAWRVKLSTVALQLLLIIGLGLFVNKFMKMQGSYTGAGVPRFVWKWTPPADANLATPAVEAAGAAVVLTPTDQDFPQFLGPHRDNSINDPGLSSDWATHPPRQLWRRPIGAGWGSFAIVNGFAITQEQRGNQELTTCLIAKTGAVVWQHANPTRFTEGMGGDGPRATPTIVDGRVYVMGATGILDSLDGSTGNVIWSRNVLADLHVNNLIWGKSCSPLLIDRLVIITGGDSPGPSVLAFDKSTGEPLWKSGTDQSAYCSPALATIAGRREIAVVNGHSVTGCDLADGTLLWSFAWPGNWPKVSQAVPFDGDRIFISAGYGLGCSMLQIRPASGGGQSVEQTWNNRKLKTEFTNIAVQDRYVYGLDDGILTCLDSQDGTRKWRDGSYGHGQILRVGGLLLVQAEQGQVALVEATPEKYHEYGTIPALTSKTWNNPALSGHLLLVRNDLEAAAYELP